jgi:hypothetical protein
MKDSRKFQKFIKGHKVYRCDECGKLTRETGEGESYVRLCLDCYNLGGLENSLADGNITQKEFDEMRPAS